MLTLRYCIELAKCKAKPPPAKEELEANPCTEMPNDFAPLNAKMTPALSKRWAKTLGKPRHPWSNKQKIASIAGRTGQQKTITFSSLKISW